MGTAARRAARIRYAVIASSAAALLAPALASAAPARPDAQGVSDNRSATSEPHWACAAMDSVTRSSTRGPSSAAGLRSDVFNRKKPEGGGEEAGIDPEELRQAYAIPATGGAGQTVAVIEGFAYKQAEKDLAKFRTRYGLAPCTAENGCLTIVDSEGKRAANHGFTEWEPEDALDLDMASAACPECHIMLVSAEEEDWNSLGAAVNYAAAHGATEISNSYGLAEETCGVRMRPRRSGLEPPGHLRVRLLGRLRLRQRIRVRRLAELPGGAADGHGRGGDRAEEGGRAPAASRRRPGANAVSGLGTGQRLQQPRGPSRPGRKTRAVPGA